MLATPCGAPAPDGWHEQHVKNDAMDSPRERAGKEREFIKQETPTKKRSQT
jgi:hypothetical protein